MSEQMDTEDWKEIRRASQIKRRSNREYAIEHLSQSNIKFDIKNDGAHLIVYSNWNTYDFWPGTGLWKIRGTKIKKRGIVSLLNDITGIKASKLTSPRVKK